MDSFPPSYRRVSVAVLAYVQDPQLDHLNFLAIENRAHRSFSPPGGALHCSSTTAEFLEREFAARFERVPTSKNRDLRFYVPTDSLDSCLEYLGRNVGSASGFEDVYKAALREMSEELVDELGVLDSLGRLHSSGSVLTRLQKPTSRRGISCDGQEINSQLTDYFFILVPATLRTSTMDRLREEARLPHAPICFVTDEEINAGKTRNGKTLASHLYTLAKRNLSLNDF